MGSLPRNSHRVGLTASLLGLGSLALPFATVSRSRIATGDPLSLAAALDGPTIALVVAPWLIALLASWLPGARERRGYAIARGTAAAAAAIALIFASGRAAGPATAAIGAFARYSLGSAVWLGVFAAFVLVVASRREAGRGTLPAVVFTAAVPAGIAALAYAGALDRLGIAVEYRNLGGGFWPAVGQHVAYSAAAIGIASVLGVGLGVLAFRNGRIARPVFTLVSAFQTVPGLALIGLLVLPLASLSRAAPGLRTLGIGGLGWAPVVLALTLYALLAIVRNTYAGLASVPPATVEAGVGMGLSERQVLAKVQMPLARGIVFSGVRTASQQTVGNATLGAFVAAGGLGPLIFLGLAQQANDLVVLGSIALVTLALVTDGMMRAVQQLVTPRTSRKERP